MGGVKERGHLHQLETDVVEVEGGGLIVEVNGGIHLENGIGCIGVFAEIGRSCGLIYEP